MKYTLQVLTLLTILIFSAAAENSTSIHTLLKSLEGEVPLKQLELVTRGIEQFPAAPELYILKARLEMGQANFTAARATLEAALAKKLTDNELLNLLGICSFHLNQMSQAEAYFNKALQEEPDNSIARYYLGILNPVKANMYSDESPVNLGELLEESKSLKFAPRPEDDYIFLLQSKEIEVKNDQLYDYTLHCVVKIITEQGIQRFRSFSQSYNNYEFYPEVLLARTYSQDGSYKNADPSAVVIIDQKDASSFYSNRKYVAFPFPNLQIGSIVEYRIRFSSTGNSLSHKVFDQFYFGAEIGTMKKVYSVSYPDSVVLTFSATSGSIVREREKNGNTITQTFTFTNPPAYDLKGETISFYDLSPQVIVSASASWEALGKWYGDIFYGPAGSGLTPAFLKEIGITGGKTKLATIETIYRYIQENIGYAAIELGGNALLPRAPGETLKNKFGDCKDQVLLTVNLLKAAGINSQPALVSTFNNGRISQDVPGIGYFNHVITYIPVQEGIDKPLFIDTTSSFTPFGNLPYQVQDRAVLIIPSREQAFFSRTPIIDYMANRMEESYLITVNPIGKARVELQQEIKGSFSEFFRAQIGRATQEERADYFYKIQKQTYPQLERTGFSLTGGQYISGDLVISCNTDFANATQVFYNGSQSLNLSLENVESLFSFPQSTRYLYSKNFLYSYKKRLEYIFPPGYKVTEHNLQSFSRSNQYISFDFTADKLADNHFVFEYQIALKERDILPENLEIVNRFLGGIIQQVKYKLTLAKTEDFDYESFFEQLVIEYPQLEVYKNFVERMIYSNKLEKAKEVCARGEQLFKKEIYFNLVLSAIYSEADQFDAAENELHKALEKDKNNFEIYRYLINLYKTANNDEKTEKILLEARKKFKDNSSVTEELIGFYQKTRQIDKAIQLMQELILQTPNQAKYYADLGFLYSLQQDFDNSELNFLKAIELDPRNSFALNNLAWLYCEFDTKLDMAIQYVLKACTLDPYNDNFWDTLAEAYFKTGQYDQAIEAIEKAIKLNPNYTYLKQQKQKIEDAKKLKDQQKKNGKQ